MPTIQLRSAAESDQQTIRQMVKDEQLDPTSLHWSHFVVAENNDEIVGIGQVRPYPRCRELGSLAVRKDFREQGVGSMIVRALLEKETGDVYLECEAFNEGYYARFGFERIPWYRAPYPLNLKTGFGGAFIWIFYRSQIIAMKRAAKNASV